MSLPPRFEVTASQIEGVVAAFYAQVRRDPVLGPVFSAKVANWPEHEQKIARFWCNAILHERSYDGNPMQIHRSAGTVKASHFPLWLALFDQVLQDKLPREVALAWSALAHRIGAGLRYGIEGPRQDGIPNLSA